MRISDWSSDVCSSDLAREQARTTVVRGGGRVRRVHGLPAEDVEHTHAEVLARDEAAGEPHRREIRVRVSRSSWDRSDRKSVVLGNSVSVRLVLGGSRFIKINMMCSRYATHVN